MRLLLIKLETSLHACGLLKNIPFSQEPRHAGTADYCDLHGTRPKRCPTGFAEILIHEGGVPRLFAQTETLV